jgi:hypothetical protein
MNALRSASPAIGQDDFDFFFGRWNVQHRKLRDRLAHCTTWDSFGGSTSAQALLGGFGNIDDNLIEMPAALGGAYRAATLRAFDPDSGEWHIWWLDGRMPTGIGVPMQGRFEGEGVGRQGVFYADEDFRGQPIRVRFLWLHTLTDKPRWEQAFSADGGRTWETNWEMDFSRVA